MPTLAWQRVTRATRFGHHRSSKLTPNPVLPTSSDHSPAASGPVALVVTVLQEAATIDALLESVARQTRPPDEVVVVDGGSTDGTWERLTAWAERLPLRAIRAPGANIARGRNVGVGATTAPWIAVTDAGVVLEPRWLERLLAARDAAGEPSPVVSGFFRADPCSTFEVALGATTLPTEADVRPATFLPSSRSLLVARAAWAAAGGYPEWLDYGEDLVFDFALRAAGCRFVFQPAAVAHFRPRSSLRAFARQYYLYARGDGKADLWRRRHAVRYGTYLGGAVAVTRWPRSPLLWVLFGVGAAAYTRRPYRRLLPALAAARSPWRERLLAVALVPLIRLVGDLAKMAGYPVGLAWRVRRGRACA